MKEKVFCIGYNKTGTTSIGKMLSDFGYNLAPQRPFEDFYIKHLTLKNKPSLFDLIEKYDAFQDIPFSKSDYYLKIYKKYPNSKYILTIRDSKEWFASLIRFHKKLGIPTYKKDSFLKLNKVIQIFRDYKMNKVLTFLNKASSDSLEILKSVHSSINNMSFHLNGYILYDLVNYIDKDSISYLEIGTYCGASACFVGKNNKVKSIYCIDPLNLSPSRFGGSISQEKILYNNLDKMNIRQKTKVFKNLSSDKNAVDYFKNKKIDILYIDGDHSFNGVVSDWENYMECVSLGGFVVFDDYYDLKHSPKVKQAVDFIVKNKLDNKFEVIGCPDNVNNIRFSRKNNIDKVGSFILLRK